MTSTPAFPQTPFIGMAALLSTTGAYTFAAGSNNLTSLVQLASGGANGLLIEGITVTSSDTSARDLMLLLFNGTTLFPMTTVSVAANSGTMSSAVPVDVFRMAPAPGLPVDSSGNKYLYLPSGSSLYVGTLTAVTAAKQVSVVAVGASF